LGKIRLGFGKIKILHSQKHRVTAMNTRQVWHKYLQFTRTCQISRGKGIELFSLSVRVRHLTAAEPFASEDILIGYIILELKNATLKAKLSKSELKSITDRYGKFIVFNVALQN